MASATRPRKQYEAADLMPEEYRELLIRLLMIQADTETRILFDDWPRYARFPELAPTLEDRMVMISYLREEAGHGYMAYKLLADLGIHLTAKDFEWYAISLDMFGRSESKRDEQYRELGLKRRSNEEARQAYIAEVTPIIEGLGFKLPDSTAGRRFL